MFVPWRPAKWWMFNSVKLGKNGFNQHQNVIICLTIKLTEFILSFILLSIFYFYFFAVCIWCNAFRSLSMYVDYPFGCDVYSPLYCTVPSKPKPEVSTILFLVFVQPCVLNQGQACWLFKDNSKLLFLLIKLWWKKSWNKTLWTLITLVTLSQCFFFSCYVFVVCLWGFFYLYKPEFYTIFSYCVVFQCELMTVFVIVAGWASLVVTCWKRIGICVFSLSGLESTWLLLCSIQSRWL